MQFSILEPMQLPPSTRMAASGAPEQDGCKKYHSQKTLPAIEEPDAVKPIAHAQKIMVLGACWLTNLREHWCFSQKMPQEHWCFWQRNQKAELTAYPKEYSEDWLTRY